MRQMKIVDCFVDGHGIETSKLVSFETKSSFYNALIFELKTVELVRF